MGESQAVRAASLRRLRGGIHCLPFSSFNRLLAFLGSWSLLPSSKPAMTHVQISLWLTLLSPPSKDLVITLGPPTSSGIISSSQNALLNDIWNGTCCHVRSQTITHGHLREINILPTPSVFLPEPTPAGPLFHRCPAPASSPVISMAPHPVVKSQSCCALRSLRHLIN